MLSSLLEWKPGAIRQLCLFRLIVCASFLSLGVAFSPQSAFAQLCFSDADCDDGNPCTDDQCPCGQIGGCPVECWHISTCDDGQYCNGTEVCCEVPGGCPGAPFGTCKSGDDVVCSGGEYCSNSLRTCVGCESNAQCDDGNDCTINSCNQSTHLCEMVVVAPGGQCNDGDPCTANDVCGTGGVCEGMDIDCQTEAPPCHLGTCVNGNCQFTPLTGNACNDNDVCTAVSECISGVCVGSDADGCVNLQLRLPAGAPAYNVGDQVEVQLWAFANGCPVPPPQSTCLVGTQDVLAVQAVVSYDPTVLALADPAVIGSPNPDDPCDDVNSCNVNCGSANYYNWGSSLFPNTCGQGDPINEPCTGVPSPDGDFFYASLAQITCNGGPADSACVRPSGMHVTSFKFIAVGATAGTESSGLVNIEQCSSQSRTKVTAGAVSGLDVLGTRSPVVVDVGCTQGSDCPFGVCNNGVCSACPPPVITAEGPRYASVTPAEGPAQVAIFVEGTDPDVSCVSGYLNSAGGITPFPNYLPPSGPGGWNEVMAHGLDMSGGMEYSFRADCDSGSPGTSMSSAVSTRLWRPGDVDNNTVVDISDAVKGVDGFRGRYLIVAADGEPCLNDGDCAQRLPHQKCDLPSGLCVWITLENVDTIGDTNCEPNGVVSIKDIVDTLQHFQGLPDSCNPRCQ